MPVGRDMSNEQPNPSIQANRSGKRLTIAASPATVDDMSTAAVTHQPRQRSNPNLMGPRWKPGESGNPAGRPRAGAGLAERYNQLAGATRDELTASTDAPESPVAKVAAARRWRDAASTDR